MSFEWIEFKAGERWKTHMGHRFIIKEIRDDEEYPVVAVSLDTGRKHFFDEDGYAVSGYPTDNDLAERIS